MAPSDCTSHGATFKEWKVSVIVGIEGVELGTVSTSDLGTFGFTLDSGVGWTGGAETSSSSSDEIRLRLGAGTGNLSSMGASSWPELDWDSTALEGAMLTLSGLADALEHKIFPSAAEEKHATDEDLRSEALSVP
jgi:hypothetical protein